MASIRDALSSYDAQATLRNELDHYLQEQGIEISGPSYSIYHGNKGQDVDIEVVQPITRLGKDSKRVKFKTLAPAEMVSVIHEGPYETLKNAYHSISQWIRENNYEISGPNQECYLKGAWNEIDPQNYLTEIRVPVRKGKAVTYASIKTKITQLAKTYMKQNNITGMSLALVDDQKIIWTISLGYANLEKKIPARADTIFRLGSISKLFTATAIMQLAEQGKIDIDQPLQTYIPEFSMKTRYPEAGPITIRSIMSHRSGIPGNYLREILNPNYPYFTTIIKDIKDEYVAYPPNYITAYSNLAITLLGVVVERVSGQEFNNYITDHILKPLEMKHSSFELHDEMKPLLSEGYRNHKPAVDDICPNISPEGSLRSSVNEMSRFLQMVLKNGAYQKREILKKATLDEMFTPHPHLPLDLEGYGLSATGSVGLNWFLDENPYWGKYGLHDGGSRLFFSRLIVLSDSKLGVVVLTNSVNGAIVADKIAIETIKSALKVKIGPPGDYYGRTETPVQKIGLQPIIAGFYATRTGLLEVVKEGKGFGIKLQKYPLIKFRLVNQPDRWFIVKPFLFGLFPVKIGDMENLRFGMAEISGAKVLLANNNGEKSIMGEKVEKTPLPAVWQKRCGKYIETDYHGLPSLNKRTKLVINQGMLMGYFTPEPFILTPISDTELLIRGLGRDLHEIIRVINVNGEERISYEGLVFKKR